MQRLRNFFRYISELRSKHIRVFVLSSLSINCIISIVLHFNGTVGIYRVYMAFTSLIIACVMFTIKERVMAYFVHFKWLDNRNREHDLSRCRQAYFLNKHPELVPHVVRSVPIWYFLILFVLIIALNILRTPSWISGMVSVICFCYLIYIIYGQYRVIRTYNTFTYPKELQRPVYRIDWSKLWTPQNFRNGLKVAQNTYRAGFENGTYPKLIAIGVFLLGADASHAYYAQKMPLFTRPTSIITEGYWTDKAWVNGMAQYLKAANYDPAKNCIQPGTLYKLDENVVYKTYTDNLNNVSGYIKIKDSNT